MTAPGTTLTVPAYRAAQDAINRELAVVALPLAQSLVDQETTESSLTSFVRTLFSTVTLARAKSELLANEFYQSQRNEYLRPGFVSLQAPEEAYSIGNLLKGIFRVVRPGQVPDSPVPAVSTVVRHAETAGRRRLTGLSLVDKECEGWARLSRGDKTCSFCLMMISRGPDYKSGGTGETFTSRKSGKTFTAKYPTVNSKAFHNQCDCVQVPVFDRENFPGRDQWIAAEKLWIESTRGKSGSKALAAFRAANHAPGGQDAVTIAA